MDCLGVYGNYCNTYFMALGLRKEKFKEIRHLEIANLAPD